MNLFTDYQKKIFNILKNLEKKKIIQIPSKLKSFSVELPPRNLKADISCNVAMILAKANNIPPIKLAEILRIHFLSNFKEFKIMRFDNVRVRVGQKQGRKISQSAFNDSLFLYGIEPV